MTTVGRMTGVMAFLWMARELSGGVTIGGQPLAEVPMRADAGIVDRIVGHDITVIVTVWVTAVLLAWLAGRCVSAVQRGFQWADHSSS